MIINTYITWGIFLTLNISILLLGEMARTLSPMIQCANYADQENSETLTQWAYLRKS